MELIMHGKMKILNKIKVCLFILTVVSVTQSFGQEMKYESSFFGGKIYQEDRISINEAVKLSKSIADANEYFRMASIYKTVGYTAGVAGLVATGISIGQEDLNPFILGLGLGGVAMNFLLVHKSNKALKDGVKDYNAHYDNANSLNFNPEIRIVGDQKGIGFLLSF